MAEATTPAKTARPARVRKAAPAKAAPPAKTEAAQVDVTAEAAAVVASTPDKRIIELEPHSQGHTKSYTKWQYPADEAGVTGTVYGPLGATGCKVLFVL